MKKRTRLLSLFLSMLVTFGTLFASCKKKSEIDGSDADQNVGTIASNDSDAEENLYAPEAVDFGGYEFKILAQNNAYKNTLIQWVWDSEDAAETTLDMAVKLRADLLFNRYGVDMVLVPSSNATSSLSTACSVGNYICDVAAIPGKQMSQLIQRGYFHNLNAISELNLSASYYDQNIREDYAIGDKLYTIEGDFSYLDDLTTMMFIYNKDIYNRYGFAQTYGTPYEMVKKQKWNYETMLTMATIATNDINTDGTYDVNDEFGLVTVTSFPYNMMMAAGLKTVDATEGTLSLMLNDASYKERVLGCISDVMDDIKGVEGKRVILAHDMDDWGVQGFQKTSEALKLFTSGKNLFRETTLSAVTGVVESDVNYGVLPMPLYFDNQTEYHGVLAAESMESLSIVKIGQENVSRVGAIVELLAYHSRYASVTYTMHSAFYDYLTELRLVQGPEDREMMVLILDSKVYDVDTAWQVTGFLTEIRELQWDNKTSALSSTLQNLILTSKESLDDINSNISNLE